MKLRAIDLHCHPSTKETAATMAPFYKAMAEHYKAELHTRTDEEMADEFRQCNVVAFPCAWDAETATGLPPTTNDYIASLVKRFPDVFPSGWASVDPWKGKMAINELERAIKELGLFGVKFQQCVFGFYPNDRQFYPLWEKCVELNIPVQFHTGVTGVGAGPRGGTGVRLKYTHPMCLDDVAVDFPDLTIIALHPSWPWQDEMLAVLQHKGNVFNELSGWSPKYFSPALKKEINGRLQDKFMFGSDYPGFMPSKWLDIFESEGYRPEVIEKIFYKNALRVHGEHFPKSVVDAFK